MTVNACTWLVYTSLPERSIYDNMTIDYDYIWPYLAIYDYIWIYVWPHIIIYDYITMI